MRNKKNIIITSVIVLVLIISLFGAIQSKVFNSTLPSDTYGIFGRMLILDGVEQDFSFSCYGVRNINEDSLARESLESCREDAYLLPYDITESGTTRIKCYYPLTDAQLRSEKLLVYTPYVVFKDRATCRDAEEGLGVDGLDDFSIQIDDGQVVPFSGTSSSSGMFQESTQDIDEGCEETSDCRSGLECLSEEGGQGVVIHSCQLVGDVAKDGEICYTDGRKPSQCEEGTECLAPPETEQFGFGRCGSEEPERDLADDLTDEEDVQDNKTIIPKNETKAPTKVELQSACEKLDCKESEICVLNTDKEAICKDFSLTCDDVICGEGFACNVNNDKAQCVEEQSPFNPTNIFIILVILLVLLTIFVLVRRT